MNAVRQLLSHVKKAGARRPGVVVMSSMGRNRAFHAWDVGDDTFVLEDGICARLGDRPSVLIASKGDLGRKARGRVMTISTGNHAVAAVPLLDGRFWGLSRLKRQRRSAVLASRVLCANVVDGAVEMSQRDVPPEVLYAADEWLVGVLSLGMDSVVIGDRNAVVLERYREMGQEWRVKPLAWTDAEIKTALAASRKRISSSLSYYHSARGVHFLSYSEFLRFVDLARDDFHAFVEGLRELVAVYEGSTRSFTRMHKHRWHHEIELFGIGSGIAQERLVPELEDLMESIDLGRAGRLGAIQRAQEIAALWEPLLASPSLADENSEAFAHSLYMNITGEVYAAAGDSSSPAFDDRRTALPGATFSGGRPVMHPGADERSRILLSNLSSMMSKDEVVEYANVYELRGDGSAGRLGAGRTREVVFKTNTSPLETSLVEKRLSRASQGYGGYMLARIGALKSLGVRLSAFYRLLRRRAQKGRRPLDFYIRSRCEGEPLDAIPANRFCLADGSQAEDRDVVLALATLMGDAAAQNMAMKKYDPKTRSPLYGVGKEIYFFEHDIQRGKMYPKSVSTCSVRGSFGWPRLDRTAENLREIAGFYLGHYARALGEYAAKHAVAAEDAAESFFGGFEFRTRAMAWRLSTMKDRFDSFSPSLPARYGFGGKLKFALWSLERQAKGLPELRRRFMELAAGSAARKAAVKLPRRREDHYRPSARADVGRPAGD